jgi:hypothetical protein
MEQLRSHCALLHGVGGLYCKVKPTIEAPAEVGYATPIQVFTGDFDHFGLSRKDNRLFLAAETV